MAGDPDFRRLPPMPDIPIEHAAVGAMGVSAPPDRPFKPYVYRGTGEDQMEDFTDKRSDPVEKAARAERARQTRIKQYERDEQFRKDWESICPDCEWAGPNNCPAHKPVLDLAPDVEDQIDRALKIIKDDPDKFGEQYRALGRRGHPSPSPGWKPPKGADVDDLLNEYDV